MEVRPSLSMHIDDLDKERISLKWGAPGHSYAILRIGSAVDIFINSEVSVRSFVEKLVSDFNEMVNLEIDRGEE